jgi:hypothetical protein
MGHGPRTLKRSRRSLGLPPFAVAAVRRRQEFQAGERAAGADWSDQWEAENGADRAKALVSGVGREGFEPPTPCASCTPDRSLPSAAVRAGLGIWGQAFGSVRRRSYCSSQWLGSPPGSPARPAHHAMGFGITFGGGPVAVVHEAGSSLTNSATAAPTNPQPEMVSLGIAAAADGVGDDLRALVAHPASTDLP